MVDLAKINWEQMRHPTPLFSVCQLTPEHAKDLVKHLAEDYLYTQDRYRDRDSIVALMCHYFSSGSNLIYEIGDWKGIFGFLDIVPGHKADILMKLWDKGTWKPSFIKESKVLMKLVMDTFELKRLNTETPDPRVVSMAKMAGLKEEGVREKGFVWNNQFYDNTLLGIVREE